jgi:ketosteroid isomerase-like protein
MKTNSTLAGFLLFSLALLTVSCEEIAWKRPKEQPEGSKPGQPLVITDSIGEVRKQIEEINQLLEIAILQGDYETQLSYFTDDVMIDPPVQPVVTGRKAIRDGYEINKKDSVVYNAFDATTEDLWVCNDKVYERGSWGMAIRSKRSPIPEAYSGSYFQIWQLEPDSVFRISFMIYSLDSYPVINR